MNIRPFEEARVAGDTGTRAVIAALLANAGIAIAKFVAFLVTRSSAMLAESVHSVADTGNQALLLFGKRQARRLPDERRPFGYGRERYFWAFVVALVLFSLGSLFALYEGIEKLRHPHEVESPEWAIGVLLIGLVLEGSSFRIAIREARLIKGAANWWQFIRRTRQPELPVVVLEDAGALLGLLIALGAVVMTMVTDNTRWDAAGTISIGVLLGIIAIVLATEMKSLLIGEPANEETVARIEAAIERSPNVQRIIYLRTLHVGPDQILVAAKLEFAHELTMREIAVAIDEVEAEIRADVPRATQIYVEPDLYRQDIVVAEQAEAADG
jgi:cation diffusion facilitator family transporter